MKKPSDPDQEWQELHNKIIGLGEKSIRKSYYPDLQKNLLEQRRRVEESEQRAEELQLNFRNRLVLNELLKLSLQDIPLDRLFEQTLEKILTLDWMISEASAAIFLLDDASDTLVLRASRGYEICSTKPCQAVPVGDCLCGLAAATGVAQFASEIDERHTFNTEGAVPHGHYCMPILLEGKTFGVLSLYLEAGHTHDEREEAFLTSVTSTLAGIIQRHRINQEKNQFEKMLLQSQKIEALGTLSGGIAHDFNNLLAPILGYSELALRDIEPDSRAARRIKEIVKAATRAKDLVKQILVLSHQGVLPNELVPLQLTQVVAEMIPLIRAAIPSTVDIRVDNKHLGCRVLCDETQIQQILLNLCTNAYHAMPETGGVIAIGLKQMQLNENDLKMRALELAVGDYLVLEVSDNGCGMKLETRDRIFDPYFTTKKQGEGTGLGLAIVNGLVKKFGGMVSVYSEPGQGSSFRIYLPCTAQDASAAEEETLEMPTGNEHILVVDDEPQVVTMTSETLQMLGYSTSHFTTCAAAIKAFRAEPEGFDLVITDMTMPKMTGLDLILNLREVRPDIPTILCTGFSALINKEKAFASGFQGYLMKPILMSELARTVRDVLDR